MNIRDRIVELRRVPASSLRPNPKNWRTHPKEQADALRGTLAEIGFAEALVARELPDGTLELIDGHLRAETVGEASIPVLVLDVSEAEADKLLATLDPLAGLAGTDPGKLAELLASVETDNEALQKLLDGLGEGAEIESPEEIEEDELPETPVEPVSKPGNLWILGDHRVLCGDASNPSDVEKLLGSRKVDLLLTDPPYGIGYQKDGSSGTHGWRDYGEIAWDRERPSRETIDSALRISKEQVVWGGNYFADYLPPSMRWLVWDKGQRTFSLADCELAWTSEQKASRVFDYSRAAALQDGKQHPTQKPVALMVWCIELADDPKTIYDPFLGSGTTLVAAERLGRTCFGIEREPAYVDIIVRRWEALTGRTATLSV